MSDDLNKAFKRPKLCTWHGTELHSTCICLYCKFLKIWTFSFFFSQGPGTYEFRWHKRCPTANVSTIPQYVSWPSPNDLQEVVSELEIRQNGLPSDCGTYKHRQELRFRAQLEDNTCDIRCQFGSVQNGFTAELSSHVTILVKRQEGKIFVPLFWYFPPFFPTKSFNSFWYVLILEAGGGRC